MKKIFYVTSLLFVFTLLVIVTTACGSATPAPKPPPTNAPAAPSATATRPVATATQPSAPTAAATRPAATATQPVAVRPELQGIVAAFAKTKTAAAFKLSEKLSGNGTIVQFSPNMPTNVVLEGTDGEFKGKDYHVKLSGLAGTLLSDDPAKGIEVSQVGGKTYIHGPAAALNAPKDAWYVLGSNSGLTMNLSVSDKLDSLAAANGNWSRFQKSRSETFDGKKCDVYSAGNEAAGAIIETVSKPILTSFVTDSGSVEMWICDDGYLHLLNASIQAHDQTTPANTGKIELSFHIFEQDGNIAVTAPANALAAASANSPAPTSAPVSPKSAATSGQNASASYDGQWEGKTSNDTTISFDVANNDITSVNLSYFVQSGSCSLSGSYSTTPNSPHVNGSAFTIQLTDSDGMQFNFTGTFTSNTQASGTLQVKGPTTNCGAIDSKSTWTAQNTPPDAQPTSDASTSSTPSGSGASSVDSTDVLLSFFDAINANDLDTAMTFVQDDVIMNSGSSTIMGNADFKTYLQKQMARNITYTASDLESTGDVVNFALRAGDNASVVKGDTAIMVDGKIQMLTLH